MSKIVIPLDNGYKLVAEQQTDSEFSKEIIVGIETPTGRYYQDLAVVRPTYKLEDGNVKYSSDMFEMLVYADEQQEDFTEYFTVPLYKDDK